jgi:hypothetical protein
MAKRAFKIETRRDGGEWRDDTLGTQNEFQTKRDLWKAVEQIKALGPDWASAEYRCIQTL